MASMVKSLAFQGVDGYGVEIEATTIDGQPVLAIIGLGDLAVKEAGERIQAALDACGYDFPKKKVIISLAPGDKKKRGSHFDLAMAIALLQQSGTINAKDLDQYALIGELGLNGSIRACSGVLPMIISASKMGIRKVIVPEVNLAEAKMLHGIDIYGFSCLQDVVRFLEGKLNVRNETQEASEDMNYDLEYLDYADVRGQNDVIAAITLAAAGGHNILLIGEPGCGKSMIVKRVPTILPEMSEDEILETTKIYSISGLLNENGKLIRQRPFRAPHHNASLNALIGGGTNALPGEVSLAHNGVLFLDELAEFSKRTLDALRQPIEDKSVSIARVGSTNKFPANFIFAAAMNPCPCGYYPSERCRCTDYEIIKYRGKISGPIMDRIDIQKEVKPVAFFDLENCSKAPSSAELREQVKKARRIQQERYKDVEGIYCNAQMTTEMIQRYCVLDEESKKILKETCEAYHYSARVIHKLLRMARTSADLDGVEQIRPEDIRKVMQCRDLDRSNSEMLVVK